MKANVADVKAHLSEYLRQLQDSGETLTICNRNEPVAELRLLPKKRIPEIGFAKGEFEVPPSFFEPLPDDILRAFNGED